MSFTIFAPNGWGRRPDGRHQASAEEERTVGGKGYLKQRHYPVLLFAVWGLRTVGDPQSDIHQL